MRPRMSALRGWRPEKMADAAADLARSLEQLDDAMDTVAQATETVRRTWEGTAAERAGKRIAAENAAAHRVAAAGLEVVDVLNAGSTTMAAWRAHVLGVESELNDQGAWVGDDGQIAWVDEPRPEQEHLAARVRSGLDSAGEADRRLTEDLEAALLAMARAADLAGPPSCEPVLQRVGPIPADAAGLSALWRSLSPPDRAELLIALPELGSRAGMPAATRDFHNRERLEDLAAEAGREAAWRIARDGELETLPQRPPVQREREGLKHELEEIATRLAGYEAVAGQLAATPGALLLDIDGRGRGAIALGNPDTASHLTTLVPGTGANLAGMGRELGRAQAMKEAAEDAAPGATHSVTAWVGYAAPPDFLEARHTSYAQGGAGPLRDFQSGLRASHLGESAHQTVVGHSYGTGVIAVAASGGHMLDADALVFLGSPGALTSTVDELSLTGVPAGEIGQRVFATKSPLDPIPLVGNIGGLVNRALDVTSVLDMPAGPLNDLVGDLVEGVFPGPLGPDPTGVDTYGAVTFSSDPGTASPWLGYNPDAHSGYWDTVDGRPGRTLRNLALIMSDQGDRIS